jgi:hypothetical protein
MQQGDLLLTLRAYGVFQIGSELSRLEWALSTTTNPYQLSDFVAPFRVYSNVYQLQDIGNEAAAYHDRLANYVGAVVSAQDMNTLREAKTRWETLVRERLERLYLITPTTIIDTRLLFGGITTLLSEQTRSTLEPTELADLNEAVWSLLVNAATAAEVMSLRAAENLLRRWYWKESGQEVNRKGWRTLLQWFTDEYPRIAEAQAELALLNYLNIRRNEVAHPDSISDTASRLSLLN